jgi:hypothetical protein
MLCTRRSRWPDRIPRPIAAVALVAALLVGALLASCASAARPRTAQPPESPVSTSPGSARPTSPSAPSPLLVTPSPGLIRPRPQSFERARVQDPKTLLVRFYGGVEACERLDHVRVEYHPRRIALTLYVGRVPGGQVCIEVAVLKATKIALREPVGGRKIVDGARA